MLIKCVWPIQIVYRNKYQCQRNRLNLSVILLNGHFNLLPTTFTKLRCHYFGHKILNNASCTVLRFNLVDCAYSRQKFRCHYDYCGYCFTLTLLFRQTICTENWSGLWDSAYGSGICTENWSGLWDSAFGSGICTENWD